jgi:hypothetical protein
MRPTRLCFLLRTNHAHRELAVGTEMAELGNGRPRLGCWAVVGVEYLSLLAP